MQAKLRQLGETESTEIVVFRNQYKRPLYVVFICNIVYGSLLKY